MKHYFGYTRVSTVKQGEKGVSLQEQKCAISNYAQRQGLTISEWFEEKETAAKKGRPVFIKMMQLLKQGKVSGVIIHKIDRSARNLKDWSDLGELIDSGVEVHFANESLDLNSRGGRLSADIQAVVAADFIRNLKDEVRKGFYGRIKQGLFPLPAPVGYLDMGKGKAKEPDPLKASLVKKAFELYGTGKFTLESLAKEMYALGLRNKGGKKVSKNSLSFLLNNPFYMGLIKLRTTGEIFLGSHKPLISKSLYDRVQNVLDGKTNAKIQQHDLLFRRALSCKHCHHSLTGEVQKGLVYYRCHTKKCLTTCIKEEAIEENIMATLASLQFSKMELAYLEEKVATLRDNWKTERESQINALSLNLSKIQDRLARLTDAYLDGTIERELFEERKTALLLERKTLEEKMADIQTGKRSVPDQMAEFFELAGSAYISYKKGIFEEKRDLLKIVTSNLTVDGKNVECKLNLPFNEAANRHEMQNSAPSRDGLRNSLDELFLRLYEYFRTQPEKLQ